MLGAEFAHLGLEAPDLGLSAHHGFPLYLHICLLQSYLLVLLAVLLSQSVHFGLETCYLDARFENAVLLELALRPNVFILLLLAIGVEVRRVRVVSHAVKLRLQLQRFAISLAALGLQSDYLILPRLVDGALSLDVRGYLVVTELEEVDLLFHLLNLAAHIAVLSSRLIDSASHMAFALRLRDEQIAVLDLELYHLLSEDVVVANLGFERIDLRLQLVDYCVFGMLVVLLVREVL